MRDSDLFFAACLFGLTAVLLAPTCIVAVVGLTTWGEWAQIAAVALVFGNLFGFLLGSISGGTR